MAPTQERASKTARRNLRRAVLLSRSCVGATQKRLLGNSKAPLGQRKAPTASAASIHPCRPAGEKRDRRGRWFLGPPGPPATADIRALGDDHLTDHRRGTHRLDHLPFSARPDTGPRNPPPRPGRRLPFRGSVTLPPAELPGGTPGEPVCAPTDSPSSYMTLPALKSLFHFTSP